MASVAESHASIAHDEHPPVVVRSSRHPYSFVGMLLFIGSEASLFGSFFFAFLFLRVVNDSGYSDWAHQMGNHIPLPLATVNTLILFSSSVTIHWASLALRRSARGWLTAWNLLTVVLGLTFFSLQMYEYAGLINDDHIGATRSAYSSIFFTLTGFHGAHVIIGSIFLIVMLVRTLRGHYGAEPIKHEGWEAMSMYWHFVDIVWAFVFGLLYLPGNLHRFNWVELVVGVVVLAALFVVPTRIWPAPKHAAVAAKQ